MGTIIGYYGARRKRRKLKVGPWPIIVLWSLGFLPLIGALMPSKDFDDKSTFGSVLPTETTSDLPNSYSKSQHNHHHHHKNSIPKHGKHRVLHDSIVISSDPEQEARKLYDEALKEFGVTGKTIKEICKPWELKGCHCSGKMEEVSLMCRGVSFNAVPFDLPDDLIKL